MKQSDNIKFDPNKPFEVVDSAPTFNPDAPFEVVEDTTVKKKEEPVVGVGESGVSPSLSSTPDREFLQEPQAEAPTSKEITPEKPKGNETVKALKSSSARAFGGVIGLPAFLTDQLGSFVVKPIAKGLGYSDEEAEGAAMALRAAPIMGATTSGLQSAEAQQQLNKYASSIESTMKQYEDGIIGSITNGNYADAGAQLWRGAVQTLPYLAMTVATSGGGTPAVLSTIGTTAAAQRYGELQDPTSEEGKKLSETGKFVNSWGYGAFEAAGELVTMGLANAAKRTLSSLGKEALEEVSQGIAKQAMKGFAEEGASEGATELSQQVLDVIQGVRDTVDFSAVTDAILVGGVTGAGISGTPTAISKAAKTIAGRKVASDADIKKVNENNAKVVDLLAEKEKATSPEAAQVIDTQLQEVVNENNEIITKNETIVEQMPPQDILKVNELDKSIAEYDSRIDDETETTDQSVLKSIRDGLQKQKDEIVSVAAKQVSETKPKEEAISPIEPISEPVEPRSLQEAPIVTTEQKEGLKQTKQDVVGDPLKDVESTKKVLDVIGVDPVIEFMPKETDQRKRQELENAISEGEMLIKSGKKVSGKKMTKEEIFVIQKSVDNAKKQLGIIPYSAQEVSEAYQKAKQDGSNPELVNAVEQLIEKQQPTVVEPQITEVEQLTTKQDGKKTSDETQGGQKGRQEVLTTEEEAKVAESTGMKPKNLRDVYTAGREIFGLNKVQALAQAVVVDRVITKAAKNAGKTKQQVYSEIEFRKGGDKTLESKLKSQQTLQGKLGATLLEDGKSIVYSLTDPNVSTPLHEIAHVYEKYMLPSEKAAVLAWTGDKAWSVSTSEKFARGFEKYLAEGVAPTEKLKAVFERFKTWLTDIYNGIKQSEIDVELNDDMRRLYDSIITGKKYVPSKEKVATNVQNVPKTEQELLSELDAMFGNVKFQDAEQYTKETIVVDGKERPTTNSKGNPIALTKEALVNFWRWFGDSKIVDKEGKPLVVYHGTKEKSLQEFLITKDIGFHFAVSEKIAKDMSGKYETEYGFSEKIPIIEAYLSIKDLAWVDDLELWRRSDLKKAVDSYNIWAKEEKKELFEIDERKSIYDNIKRFAFVVSEKEGSYKDIDGLAYINEFEGRFTKEPKKSFIVFSSNQIKSATGNIGTFSSESDNILFQEPQNITPEDFVNKLIEAAELLKKDAVEYVNNYLKAKGNPIDQQLIDNILKQRGYAKGTRTTTEEAGQQTQGVVEGEKRRIRVRDDAKDRLEAQKGEGVSERISQHYKKLIDPKSGVSAETRKILENKDGSYDAISKSQLNRFADELIGSALRDGVEGLDMIFEDLKSDNSKLIPQELNGANVTVSYKLAYQYERLGMDDKAAEVDMWRKKFGTGIAQTLSAFDEMAEAPEQRIRRLRGEMKADRDVKMDKTGTTGKKISEEISDVQQELNDASLKALKEENEALKKKIQEIIKKEAPKGSVKARPILLDKTKAKELADKIRSFKIKEDKLMAADPLTAAYVITRNGTLSLVAEVVEQTGNVSDAISKGISAFRKSDWYKKLNKSEQTVYENKYRKFLKDEFGLENTFSLEKIDIEGLSQEALEVVNDHWTKVKNQEKSLETKLIEIGLSSEAANQVAKQAKELVYDYVRENGLTNIKKLFKDRATSKAQAKIKETASQNILNMIREGAVNSDGLVDALADFYGYGKIGFDVLDRAAKLANEAAGMKPGVRKTALLEEFESLIYELDHGTAKKIYDAINDIYNTSILSAPTTTSRAAKGMALTGLAHMTIATIANPRAMFLGGFRHFFRGAWAGTKVIPQAIKTGIGSIDVSDIPSNVSYIRRIVNKPLGEHWKEFKAALKKSTLKNPSKELSNKMIELSAKVFYHLPVKMYRSLLALDAPMKTGLIEMEAFIEEWNNSMSTPQNISISRRLAEVNKKLARDNKTIRDIRKEIDEEIADIKQKGEKIPRNYKAIRELELVELMRDMETVETAKRLANQALLMNTPEGVFTGGMYSLLRNITNVSPKPVEVKDKETGKVRIRYKVSPQQAAAALALKFIFPIIRVPANFLRTVSGYTPIGFVRAMMKETPYVKGKDRAERIKSTDERIRQASAAAVGTTIGFMLAAMIFDWDDEEETIGLSEDAPIKVTFMGTGDNTKNKTISSNYKEISFSLRRPEWAKSGAGRTIWDASMGGDDNWSDPISYIDNPLGMILAPIGYVSDRLRHFEPKPDADGNIPDVWDGNVDLFMSIAWNAMAFGTSQSYMQGANDLLRLIPQNSKEVPTNFKEDAYNFFNRPVTALFSPNLYQFAHKQYRAAMGIPEKKYSGMFEKIARFIPSLEDEMSGEKTDQFGYPVTREFMIPFVPDALTDIVENWKEEKLRRGTKEWELILDREKVVLPRSWKTDDKHYKQYSDENREMAEENAKIFFREYVTENYDWLKELSDEELQEEIKSLRQDGIDAAKMWLEYESENNNK